jgi:DNA-binding GntR family transcriptional regulator
MAPGSSIPIGLLGELLGISSTPVREALRALESDGLILLRPNRQAVVAPLVLDELRDIYRARKLFEVEIIGRSAKVFTFADLDDLSTLLEALSDTSRSPDVRRDSHKGFHLLLLKPAATEFDTRVLEMLWNAGDRYIRLLLSEMTEADIYGSHDALLEAARLHQPRQLRAALATHLDNGLKIMTRILASRENQSNGLDEHDDPES